MLTENIDITDLSRGAIDSRPVDFDWSEGYGEAWEYRYATICENCGEKYVADTFYSTCYECDTEQEGNEGPMMNYWYPLPDPVDDDDLMKLDGLPLTYVVIDPSTDPKYGLALTGGGMDLSWEICEAFMALGYLPPLHFCNLPAMAGRGTSARDKAIIEACRQSIRTAKDSLDYRLHSLERTETWSREYEEGRIR